AAMTRGAVAVLGDAVAGGVVITSTGAGSAGLGGLETFAGGHPIPNRDGVAGARAIRRMARAAGADDLLLVLVSGGGSALMTLPPDGVSLEDVQATTDALLKAGADIGELNTVRKHLDLLKGGQLARAAAPTRIVALILSDVIGDPLDVIASGPVSPDPSTFEDAVAVLEAFDLWDRVPESVGKYLAGGVEGAVDDTPISVAPCFEGVETTVVGNNRMAAEAARVEAERRGYQALLTSVSVTGEARGVGKSLARAALRKSWPACLVSAGETTVTVTGDGRGGRNQEVALGAVRTLHGFGGVLVASFGTDGIDGPTDAAGAIATGESLARARALGLDPEAALAENDSYAFFEALGDLIVTGPTGTNVMDIQLVMVGETVEQRVR
ncbi:MAG: glycerate kinase, partial [Thermoanaerobaculia bacterium]